MFARVSLIHILLVFRNWINYSQTQTEHASAKLHDNILPLRRVQSVCLCMGIIYRVVKHSVRHSFGHANITVLQYVPGLKKNNISCYQNNYPFFLHCTNHNIIMKKVRDKATTISIMMTAITPPAIAPSWPPSSVPPPVPLTEVSGSPG